MTTAAEMELRIEELRCERDTAAEASASARQAVARALVDGAPAAELMKRRKAQAEAAGHLAALDEAIGLAEDEVTRLRADEAHQAEAAAIEADLSEMASIANTLPKIAEHLDAVLVLVEAMTPRGSMRRRDMFGALGSAFRGAVQRSNEGKQASVRPALDEMASSWRRNAERRARAMVASGEASSADAKPMPSDTAIYALGRFMYADGGDRNVGRISVPAGALRLVPRPVAISAVAEGIAKLVPVNPGVRLAFTKGHRTASGLVFPQGGEALVSQEEAAALPPGVAEPLERLLDVEVVGLRKEYPVREQRGMWHDLGVFNATERIDEKTAMSEPQAPLSQFADLDAALGDVERGAAA